MLISILDSIGFYFLKLKDIINEISTYSFYTEDYKILALNLKSLNKKMSSKFSELKNEIKIEIESGRALIEIYKEYNEILITYKDFFENCFNLIIEFLKNSENFYAPYSLFVLIEEFIEKIGDQTRFIIAPLFEINYGFANISEFILDNLTSFLNEEQLDKFVVFAIPYFNRDDILSNSLIAHEIGHLIESKNHIAEKIFENFSESKIHRIREISQQLRNEIASQDIRYHFDNVVYQVIDWIKEVISDKIGLSIFGLSYFFAFIYFIFLTNPYSKGSDHHPPNWLRLKILINDVKSNKFQQDIETLSIIKEGIEIDINDIITFLNNNFTSIDNIIDENFINIQITELFDYELLDQIDEGIKDKAETYFYIFNIDEIKELIALLDEYITPNQIIDDTNNSTNPANIISILNAGWIYFLYKIENHYDFFEIDNSKDSERMRISSKLNDLISKGIELSKLEERYKINNN